MYISECIQARKVHAAVLVCAGLLMAQSAIANAQSQKDYSSSQDSSVYANGEYLQTCMAVYGSDCPGW